MVLTCDLGSVRLVLDGGQASARIDLLPVAPLDGSGPFGGMTFTARGPINEVNAAAVKAIGEASPHPALKWLETAWNESVDVVQSRSFDETQPRVRRA